MDLSKLKHITTFVFDVDGVFTNSNVLITENGELLRTMNTRDGQAVKIALENGFEVAIITKGWSEGVRKRFELLGINYIYDKLTEKTKAMNSLLSHLKITKEQVLYMGDDLPDLPLYNMVGVSACPADAAHENLEKAEFITSKKGGEGCVREIIEKVMKLQGKWSF